MIGKRAKTKQNNQNPHRIRYNQLVKEKEIDLEAPYSFELENSGQTVLIYVGVEHTYDPLDPTIDLIDEKWAKFITLPNTDKVVILEGGKKPSKDPPSKEEAIKNLGEPEYLRFLAITNNIPWESPELTDDDYIELFSILKNTYPEDYLVYYLMARFQRTLVRKGLDDKEREEEIKKRLHSMERRSYPFPEYDYSYKNIMRVHSLFMDEAGGDAQEKELDDIGWEIRSYRDSKIVERIVELLKKGKCLFVVYGRGHAIVQEEDIKVVFPEEE